MAVSDSNGDESSADQQFVLHAISVCPPVNAGNSGNKMEGALVKGPNLIKLSALRALLVRYPSPRDRDYLFQKFSEGFWIPY